MNILVSIICMAYNHEKYIRDAIESFLMQETDFEFEILIGEDCSTDNTQKIIKEYEEKYPEKVNLITSEVNVGWRRNSERLFENSKGKYIAICEGDDFWTDPNKLQKQVDYMEAHPECSFCFHAAGIVDADGRQTGKKLRPYKNTRKSLTGEVITGGGEFCPTPSILFPKKLMENPPDFYENAHVGDYPLQLWLACQGYGFYMDEIMASYRSGAIGSWTRLLNSGQNIIEKNINARKADIKLLNEFNEYTNFDFMEEVIKMITKYEFDILIFQNKLKEIKKDKYKIYYKNLNFTQKTKIYSKYFFPKIYTKIVDFKRNFNS